VRTYLKNIAQVPQAFDGQIASTGFCVIRLKESLNKKFYFYLALSDQFINPLSKIQRGTSYPAVRNSDVLEQKVPLPPRPEQDRIVAKLEETFTQLEAGVAELGNAKAQLKRYRAAVLKSAVEGELTREWREAHQGEIEPAETLLARILSARWEKWESEGGRGNYNEPTAPNTDDLPELPDGWVWASVAQLADVTGGLTVNRKRNSHSLKMPYLRVANVYANELRLDEVKTIAKKYRELLFIKPTEKKIVEIFDL